MTAEWIGVDNPARYRRGSIVNVCPTGELNEVARLMKVTKRGLRVRPSRNPYWSDPLPNFVWPRFVVRYRPYDHEWDGM